ncbi:MAG TPA: hypothetical protein VG010_09320, partial [Solirubrobacteraceae bacterium]|nr:hypothetical protein [Solirubrobacteraceae bacterium]
AERFGENLGRDIGRRARFEHDGAIGAPRKVASESRERTFDRDVSDPDEQRGALARMAAELCEGLSTHGRRGRTIAIKVRLDDFTTVTRARTVSEATCDASIVTEVALALLREYSPPRPVRLLGVRVAGLLRDRADAADAEGDEEPGGDRGIGTARRHGGAGQLALPV